MRIFGVLMLWLSVWPGTALAHIGHLGEVARHSHWIAIGAIGLAGAIAAWAGAKGKADAAEENAEEDGDEAPA